MWKEDVAGFLIAFYSFQKLKEEREKDKREQKGVLRSIPFSWWGNVGLYSSSLVLEVVWYSHTDIAKLCPNATNHPHVALANVRVGDCGAWNEPHLSFHSSWNH